MNRTRSIVITSALAVGSLALAACGSSSTSSDGASGSVRVDGSSTVAPLTSAAAEKFKTESPNINVTVATSGTGGGFEKFCRGETDMNDASRPIKDEEAAICKQNGIEFQELVIANDALSVVVNKENTWAKCLTTAQLKKIWEPKSTVNNWNQVDPSFPNEPIKLYGPGTDSGTFDYFTDEINGEEGASRTDFSPSEDDNQIVQGVSSSKGGMGYFGFTYYEENADKLNLVQVNSGNGCITPSAASVQDGTYTPLGRGLFIYPSAKSLGSNTAFQSFLQYYVNNDAEIAEAAQFIPLSPTQQTTLQNEYAAVLKMANVSASPAAS
ncbi:MAG: PstS family phosphate ABC transporter substrate-binding protein [Candidatus Nanopelagicales bacterium]